MLDYLRADKVYSMAGSRYVLTEFSASTEEKYVSDRIYELLSGGYRRLLWDGEYLEVTPDADGGVLELGEQKFSLVRGETRRVKI